MDTWASPAQMARKPAPVPVEATLTRTPEFCLLNSSAMASLMGNTVLEPAIAMVPLRLSIELSVLAESGVEVASIAWVGSIAGVVKVGDAGVRVGVAVGSLPPHDTRRVAIKSAAKRPRMLKSLVPVIFMCRSPFFF